MEICVVAFVVVAIAVVIVLAICDLAEKIYRWIKGKLKGGKHEK